MRVVKHWLLPMGATVLLGSVSWSCFVVPECTGCSDGSGDSGGGGTTTTGSTDDNEDCMDGVDNDGDGDADCSDSDCAPDFECVPAPPDGWLGLYEISVVDYATALPACEDGKEPDQFFAEPAGQAECTECSCGPLVGKATCSPPQLKCWPGLTDCTGNNSADWTIAFVDEECHKPAGLLGDNDLLSCKITAAPQPVGDGTCTPFGGKMSNEGAWKKRVGVCNVPSGGGCAKEKACVAVGGGETARCFRREGHVDCPDGLFTEKILVYSSFLDTRACSPCTCSPTCAGGSYTVHDPNDCAPDNSIWIDPPLTIDSGTCTDVSGLLDAETWSMNASLPDPPQACTPQGGAPGGNLTPLGPVTICCRP